jgi:radical SAM superfamily enzyme YgiQ (UPF0313 family)
MARVLFLQDVLFEAFGPEVLSSVLKREGHDCDMLVASAVGERNLMREIRRFDPDILAFSISSFGYRWSVDFAREAKREFDVLTVFGGAHPTFFPEFAHEEGVDYACIGEGERAIVDLANTIGNGHSPNEVANLARHGEGDDLIRNPLEPLVEDLDSLPFPDREVYFKYAPLRELGFKRFMVGRGCPYGCTYCTNRVQQEMYSGLGKYVRHREPEKVVEEILEVQSRYGIKTVGFSDDTFTTNKNWTMRFLELYRNEVALPFTCLTRINEIDEEIVEAMAGAGCHFVSFGLEAGSEHIRRQVLNRRMSDDQIRTGARLLHPARPPRTGCARSRSTWKSRPMSWARRCSRPCLEPRATSSARARDSWTTPTTSRPSTAPPIPRP